MKNSNCGSKILEQILQQIQSTDHGNDLVLLTTKFNIQSPHSKILSQRKAFMRTVAEPETNESIC